MLSATPGCLESGFLVWNMPDRFVLVFIPQTVLSPVCDSCETSHNWDREGHGARVITDVHCSVALFSIWALRSDLVAAQIV